MGKMQTTAKPNKIYIVGKVLMRAIQNMIFCEFEPLCQRLWVFIVKFTKTETFYFSPDFVLNFRKCYQIWGKLAEEQKIYKQKQIGR